MKIKWKIKKRSLCTMDHVKKKKEKEKYDIILRGSQVVLYVDQWDYVK